MYQHKDKLHIILDYTWKNSLIKSLQTLFIGSFSLAVAYGPINLNTIFFISVFLESKNQNSMKVKFDSKSQFLSI